VLFVGLLPTACYRTSSVTSLGLSVGSSKVSRGPVTVDAQSHAVADGHGILFENRVVTKDGFEHRVALLMLASEEFWYSIDLNADITSDPERTDGRELAQSHADFRFQGSVMSPGMSGPIPVASATPYISTSSGALVIPDDPNRITATVPIDPGALSAPAAAPYLSFRGEQVPAADGSLFLVILHPDGPKRPTRLATDMDLSQVSLDPEGFVDRVLEEQPLLREVLEEAR
jgi:hypothetical protein